MRCALLISMAISFACVQISGVAERHGSDVAPEPVLMQPAISQAELDALCAERQREQEAQRERAERARELLACTADAHLFEAGIAHAD